MKRVLVIASFFSPVNTPGAFRISKYVKYLPEFGWTSIVLTTDKTAHTKKNLVSEKNTCKVIRASTKILGIQTINRTSKIPIIGNIIPNPITWYLPAIKAGIRILNHCKIDVIFSSYYPSAPHFIAAKLHSKYRIPWIAEFRDLWSDNPYISSYPMLKEINKYVEKRLLYGSQSIVTVSEGLCCKLQRMHSKNTIVVANSYDENDYKAKISLTRKFTVTYTGYIYTGKRDPTPVIQVIAYLKRYCIINTSNFEMRFFGHNIVIELSPLIKYYDVRDLVRLEDSISFIESIQKQKESTILLSLGWDDERDKDVYTSKIFNYLGANRPILALGYKNSVVDKLLENTGTGVLINDIEGLRKVLLSWLIEWYRYGKIMSYWNPHPLLIQKYTSRESARELSNVFNRSCVNTNQIWMKEQVATKF